jgi:plasmid maintenance system antidote protein VapI
MIKEEVVEFLSEVGCTIKSLADEAGVNPVSVQNLVNGAQKDIASASADALRVAMKKIRQWRKGM